jgi:hypothetical protein
MLKVEFPEEATKLFDDVEASKELEFGTFLEAGRRNAEDGSPAKASSQFAPNGTEARERFLRICEGLRENGLTSGKYSLRELFYLIERPEIVTWRELISFFESFEKTAPEQRRTFVDEWLTKQGPNFATAAITLFSRIVKLRDSILDAAADADTESATLGRLEHVSTATLLLHTLLEDFGVLHSDLQEILLWTELYNHVSRWSGWTRPKYYLKYRDEESDLLEMATQLLPGHLHGEAYIWLKRREHSHINPPSPGFLQVVNEIERYLTESATLSALVRFSEQNGVDRFWGNTGSAAEKQVAFEPEATFHTPVYRDQLRAIAARAHSDEGVHRNFLTYFRMLAYGALGEATTFPRSSCRTLLADNDFARFIWNAAVAQPLNLRTAGSLLKERDQLIDELHTSAEILVLPKWLQRMHDEYFPTRELED